MLVPRGAAEEVGLVQRSPIDNWTDLSDAVTKRVNGFLNRTVRTVWFGCIQEPGNCYRDKSSSQVVWARAEIGRASEARICIASDFGVRGDLGGLSSKIARKDIESPGLSWHGFDLANRIKNGCRR